MLTDLSCRSTCEVRSREEEIIFDLREARFHIQHGIEVNVPSSRCNFSHFEIYIFLTIHYSFCFSVYFTLQGVA